MTAGAFVWRPWAVLAAFALAAGASFAYLGVDFGTLFGRDSLRQMALFAQGFVPPDTSPEFLRRTLAGAAETLAISAVGTLLAAHAGAGATLAFLYGTLPMALPQFTSYALYRWEYNIRMAAVLGFVGAGGLGQMLYVSLSVFKTHEAATLLIAMIAMVSVVDLLSAWLRRFLGRSGT
jgi:ABC-type phosphate/phosphonate transport system permease subunit